MRVVSSSSSQSIPIILGQMDESRLFLGQALEIFSVAGFSVEPSEPQQLGGVDEALAEGDFLDAADLLAGALFEHAHEFRGLEQRVVRPGVEPGIATAETFDAELAGGEVGLV